MQEILIDPKTWRRATPEQYSEGYFAHLFHADMVPPGADKPGMMCCLGFFCNQFLGVAREDMRYVTLPTALAAPSRMEISQKLGITEAKARSFFRLAALINDNPDLGDEDRIEALNDLTFLTGLDILFTLKGE